MQFDSFSSLVGILGLKFVTDYLFEKFIITKF